jgi:hypothetical protein
MAGVKHASLSRQKINYERKSALPSATESCLKFGNKTFFKKSLGIQDFQTIDINNISVCL